MGNLFGGGGQKAAAPVIQQAPAPIALETPDKKKLRQGATNKTQTTFSSPLGASSSSDGLKTTLGA